MKTSILIFLRYSTGVFPNFHGCFHLRKQGFNPVLLHILFPSRHIVIYCSPLLIPEFCLLRGFDLILFPDFKRKF